jgi:hypothetical protein
MELSDECGMVAAVEDRRGGGAADAGQQAAAQQAMFVTSLDAQTWKAFGDAVGADSCLMARRGGRNDREAWFGDSAR